MKLLNSFGPNPRLVRMFLAEKGMSLDSEDLDLMGGDNRAEPYLKKNPGGQMPALELDDGSVIAETVTICEYLEERQPEPVLIGNTPESRANPRMWVRHGKCEYPRQLSGGRTRCSAPRWPFSGRRPAAPPARPCPRAPRHRAPPPEWRRS